MEKSVFPFRLFLSPYSLFRHLHISVWPHLPMPMSFRKNLPNYLTYFRIAVIPALTVVFFLKGEWSYTLSALLFFIAGVTDWLDGYVARIWQAQSNIGRFLDPIADKLLVATALMLLV